MPVTHPDSNTVMSIAALQGLAEIETQFIGRVFATPPERYEQTLRSVGLSGLARVADIGAGYGQWSLCLAGMNEEVIAVEPQEHRRRFIEAVIESSNVDNIRVQTGSAETPGLDANSIDGILCFGVLQYADADAFFAQCARALTPGGTVYVLGKDVGGYVCDWLQQRNRSDAFDPRNVATDAFANTLHLEFHGCVDPRSHWTDRIIPLEDAVAAATRAGLRIISAGPEGGAVEAAATPPGALWPHPSHFFPREFRGLPFSYELLLRR